MGSKPRERYLTTRKRKINQWRPVATQDDHARSTTVWALETRCTTNDDVMIEREIEKCRIEGTRSGVGTEVSGNQSCTPGTRKQGMADGTGSIQPVTDG